jgi:hypothetical protein
MMTVIYCGAAFVGCVAVVIVIAVAVIVVGRLLASKKVDTVQERSPIGCLAHELDREVSTRRAEKAWAAARSAVPELAPAGASAEAPRPN